VVIKQGMVLWVDLAEPIGSAPGFRRPCVVVQNNAFNRSKTRTVVVCPITSNLARGAIPGNTKLDRGEASLPKPSVVIASQIITVDRSQLGSVLGTLSKKRLRQVLQGVFLVLESDGID
jgi:mRNA interferase MazF